MIFTKEVRFCVYQPEIKPDTRIDLLRESIPSSDNQLKPGGLKSGDIIGTSGAYLINSEYIFKNGSNPMGAMKM